MGVGSSARNRVPTSLTEASLLSLRREKIESLSNNNKLLSLAEEPFKFMLLFQSNWLWLGFVMLMLLFQSIWWKDDLLVDV